MDVPSSLQANIPQVVDITNFFNIDFESILNKFGAAHDIILTTEKDYYRLKGTGLANILPQNKFFFTRAGIEWLIGKNEFENEISTALKQYGN